MNNKLLNPFDLFGLNLNSSISELKKSFYNLSLICHPDKGGNSEEMIVLLNAYNYLKKQLENNTNKSYEDLEKEFKNFCDQQEKNKPPNFSEIYLETNDWINDFNKQFENKKNDFLDNDNDNYNPYENDLFKNLGYGHLMENSNLNYENYNDKIIEESQNEIKNNFKMEIIEYKEPLSFNDIGHNQYPLDKKDKIEDFSTNKLKDYFKAYCNINFQNNFENFDVNERYNKELELRNLNR